MVLTNPELLRLVQFLDTKNSRAPGGIRAEFVWVSFDEINGVVYALVENAKYREASDRTHCYALTRIGQGWECQCAGNGHAVCYHKMAAEAALQLFGGPAHVGQPAAPARPQLARAAAAAR